MYGWERGEKWGREWSEVGWKEKRGRSCEKRERERRERRERGEIVRRKEWGKGRKGKRDIESRVV